MSADGTATGTRIAVACSSLRGSRPQQEDAAGWVTLGKGVLLVLADGMGGTGNGAFAAHKACQAFLRMGVNLLLDSNEVQTGLQDAAAVANGVLLGAKQARGWGAVGTTVVAALLRGGKLTVAHAGDSRAYLVTHDDVELLTRDHAPAQALVEGGKAPNLAAARRLVGNGVTRCLGDEDFPGLEVRELDVSKLHDALLVLTTDGAHEFLAPHDFLHHATGSSSVSDFVERLAWLALARGSRDNVTVVAAELGSFRRSGVAAAPVVALTAPKKLGGRSLAALVLSLLVAFGLGFGVARGLLLGGWQGRGAISKTTPTATPCPGAHPAASASQANENR